MSDAKGHVRDRGPRTVSLWIRAGLPAILIVIWLVAASFGGPTFGKLSGVSNNDQASYLPASAESTKVNQEQARFTDSKAIPAIVLLVSDSTLSASDLAGFTDFATKLAAVDGVQKPSAGETTTVAGPIPSKDGKAVEFIVPITSENDVDTVVDDLRTVSEQNKPDGTTAYVTGPAGLTADLVSAFGGIDGILLLVAIAAVLVILLVVYRALLLPFLVLFTAMFALTAAILLVYAFASWKWITLNGQSQGILSILVIGAATDYSLLLVARFREALHTHESRWEAVWTAWKAVLAPVTASAATVVIALLCLLFSDLNSNKSLGPIAAIGIVFAYLAALTLLPAFLALFGRAAFWPFRPRYEPDAHQHAHAAGDEIPGLQGATGVWRRAGALIAKHHRVVWIVVAVVLLAGGAGLLQLKASGVAQSDVVLGNAPASAGQKVLAEHYDAGSGAPVVIITSEKNADAVLAKTKDADGITTASVYAGDVRPGTTDAAPIVKDGNVLIQATLKAQPDSDAAEKVVQELRRKLPAADPGVLVGGQTAIALDTNTTAERDLATIIPIVLLVILIILMILLRSLVTPLVLIGTVVLSYGATLGVSAIVFNHVFHFPGADPTVPLFGFVFLVALGVDYNIFLMTRVREESLRIGTRPGILRGLAATGGVITSAGIVLAATFAALAVIPILFLAQIAFIVAFGVLLDTLVVRSLLVPALSYDIGRAGWWPSRLWRSERDSSREDAPAVAP